MIHAVRVAEEPVFRKYVEDLTSLGHYFGSYIAGYQEGSAGMSRQRAVPIFWDGCLEKGLFLCDILTLRVAMIFEVVH